MLIPIRISSMWQYINQDLNICFIERFVYYGNTCCVSRRRSALQAVFSAERPYNRGLRVLFPMEQGRDHSANAPHQQEHERGAVEEVEEARVPLRRDLHESHGNGREDRHRMPEPCGG